MCQSEASELQASIRMTHLEDIDRLIEAVFDQQRKAGLDPDDEREVPFP